jgi:hypothetical protein
LTTVNSYAVSHSTLSLTLRIKLAHTALTMSSIINTAVQVNQEEISAAVDQPPPQVRHARQREQYRELLPSLIHVGCTVRSRDAPCGWRDRASAIRPNSARFRLYAGSEDSPNDANKDSPYVHDT